MVFIGLAAVFFNTLFVTFKRCRRFALATSAYAANLQRAVYIRGLFERDARLADGALDRLLEQKDAGSTLILHIPQFVAGGERTVFYRWDRTALRRTVLNGQGAVLSGRILGRPAHVRFTTGKERVSLELRFARVRGRREPTRRLLFSAALGNAGSGGQP